MVQVDDIQGDVQLVLDSMGPYVDRMSRFRWSPSDGVLSIVLRSTLRRQFDALEVISHLIADRTGFSAGQLLRPACEEMIWTKYLTSIPQAAAEALVRCCTSKEVREGLRAQDSVAGRTTTKALGLLPFLDEAEERRTSEREILKTLGRKLGWPARHTEKGKIPPISWLARKTNELDTYRLIYHATSRLVHFSASELTRGAWYDPNTGSATISHAQFRDVHGHLCLYWGVLLLIQIWHEMPEEFSGLLDEMHAAKIDEAVGRISKAGRPPIITAEELLRPG